MKDLLRFLATYQVGIFVFLGIIAAVNIYRLFHAWFEKRNAYFGLEREVIHNTIRSSLTIIALVLLLGLTQFMLVSVLTIKFPGLIQLTTPTIDLISTPTIPLTEIAGTVVTPQGYDATQTAIAVTGCDPGQLEWTSPKNGDEINGSVELKGTVNIPNQGFYKYEYQQVGKEDWKPIAAGSKTILDDFLGGKWDTSQDTPGNYLLRLVVSDNQNNLLKPCTIQVKVIPT
jgi:hypothetical protein